MEFMCTYLTDLSTSREDYEILRNYFPLLCIRKYFSMWIINSPCETAGLEQLRVKGILELPGVNDESSQCLLFILLAVVVELPQFEVDDALLLLSVENNNEKTIKYEIIEICATKIYRCLRLRDAEKISKILLRNWILTKFCALSWQLWDFNYQSSWQDNISKHFTDDISRSLNSHLES